jgi:hypothetical protein
MLDMRDFNVPFNALGRSFRRKQAWLIACVAGLSSACSITDGPSTLPPVHIPQERVRDVCWKPSELDADTDTIDTTDTGDVGEYFVLVNHTGPAISSKKRIAFGQEVHAGAFIYKYVESAPIQNLRLIPLTRTDAWCNRIPKPTDEAVLKLLNPCAEASLMPDGRSVAKNLFAQAENLPIRSGLFCGKLPQMAPTTADSISLFRRNIAYQESYDYAYKTAKALTQAEADMQSVINKDRGWLKQALTSDPGSLEKIQQRVADALNSINAPPEYDDPELESLALLGFESGFDNGKFEVEAKLFAIDAGIMLVEFAAMEVALGPLGGAKFLASAVSKGGKALTAAMSRLENIPIFIPGAIGGAGGMVRIGKVVNASKKALSKAHVRALEKALELAGWEKKAGESTHHIVAHSSEVEGAEKCRELFANFKLDINKEYNGVFLPWTKNSPNPAGALVHQTLDNPVYYRTLARALGKAKTQKQAINMLKRVRETLLDGTFYHANL